ncbi:MAG: chromosomal replication initiator protein DnaA [FCB group bacterium]|nr:chromosomal replication initiator protein DnaA [FCB group bacterium]
MSYPAPQHNLWQTFIDKLSCDIPRESFHTWFRPIRFIKIDGKEITVQIPSQFYYDWIEEHYSSQISSALCETFGDGFTINYSIILGDKMKNTLFPFREDKKISSGPPKATREASLNPRYTFENFIEGECNNFAKAAALAVSEAPGKTRFNPLVIYGGVGLGKTHLIQAIGNFALKHQTIRKALYVSSEKFTIDFITSVKENKTTDFSSLYRSTDLLLVDDVQFFEGKERTQMEFFYTFNTLYQAGKQLVLSLDRPPSELFDMEARLLSRFKWGLITDIQPPDLETRVAILQRRSEEDNIQLSPDIIDYLAKNITSNVRELEGALIKLLAHASITGTDITLAVAQKVLRDIIGRRPKKVSIELIQETVARLTGVPPDIQCSDSRKKEIAYARQLSIYLCNNLTNMTLKLIGAHFGNRDHTTVLHSIDKIKKAMFKDPEFAIKIRELIKQLES